MAGGRWKKIFQKLSISASKRNEKKPKLNYHQELESQGRYNLHFDISIDKYFITWGAEAPFFIKM